MSEAVVGGSSIWVLTSRSDAGAIDYLLPFTVYIFCEAEFLPTYFNNFLESGTVFELISTTCINAIKYYRALEGR